MKTFLITGGAGFVGSNLAIQLKKYFVEQVRIICFDNLKRRGSELSINRLKENGIEFVHGDIRNYEDLETIGKTDIIIECSAEPSVLAGYGESPNYLVQTNLNGTINCLEVARRHGSDFIFLSTSRVYPIKTMSQLKFVENKTRFKLCDKQKISGTSKRGISEAFPLEGVRSLYGATKLCSEYIIQEYCEMYKIRGVINRCGVLTGPWQMGKVDQGVVSLWVAKHIYGGTLNYVGYGGQGKQVRDILAIDDLYELLVKQMENLDLHNGQIYNVGGGVEVSTSLMELTQICEKVTGNKIKIDSIEENRVADIPYYITDTTKVKNVTGWFPKKNVHQIVEDIAQWIQQNKQQLQAIMS